MRELYQVAVSDDVPLEDRYAAVRMMQTMQREMVANPSRQTKYRALRPRFSQVKKREWRFYRK